jgi:hypothetical protein
LRFALKLSDEIEAVHIDTEEEHNDLEQVWQRDVAGPIAEAGLAVPKLVCLPSPYRFVLAPLVDYILQLESQFPDRQIAVLVPQLIVKRWWQAPLHNQRAQLLKLLLIMRGNQRISIINIPWYL